MAESCVFAEGELTPIEAEIHQANIASRTSVFEVVTVHDSEPAQRLLIPITVVSARMTFLR